MSDNIFVANKNDAKILNIINKICLPENYDIEFWLDTISYGNSFVYKIDNSIVGYILVNQNAYIISFAILPKYRKQNIGTILLNHTLNTLSKYFSTIKLSVRSSNKNARNLYSKCNFIVNEIIPNRYVNPVEDEIKMIYNTKNNLR